MYNLKQGFVGKAGKLEIIYQSSLAELMKRKFFHAILMNGLISNKNLLRRYNEKKCPTYKTNELVKIPRNTCNDK